MDAFLLELQKDFAKSPGLLESSLSIFKSSNPVSKIEAKKSLESLMAALKDLQFLGCYQWVDQSYKELRDDLSTDTLQSSVQEDVLRRLEEVQGFLRVVSFEKGFESQEKFFFENILSADALKLDKIKFLILEQGKQLLAVRVADIEGILETPKIYSLPHSDSRYVGMTDFRGRPILIQKSNFDFTQEISFVLVVTRRKERFIGSLYHRALELVEIDPSHLRQFAESGNRDSRFELGRWNEKIVEIVNDQERLDS
jgi:chemotaxis signal transduction protein